MICECRKEEQEIQTLGINLFIYTQNSLTWKQEVKN